MLSAAGAGADAVDVLAGAATSADNGGLAMTASAVGGAGAAVAGAPNPFGAAFADALDGAPAEPFDAELTFTKDERPVSAPRVGVESASRGDKGSNAPRSPLPLTSVSRGDVRPATAHGIAAPPTDLAPVLAYLRTGGEARDDGDALGRPAAAAVALLRATRDGAGNGIALRPL